jgi:hypothetical protein
LKYFSVSHCVRFRMSRTRKIVRKVAETNGDISFPVSYREQAKYLKLADDFLALDKPRDKGEVISIQAGRYIPSQRRKKSA